MTSSMTNCVSLGKASENAIESKRQAMVPAAIKRYRRK